MRDVEYVSPAGRMYKVRVPDEAPKENYQYGLVIGPPAELVEVLGLPEPIATRFHNALYKRGMLTYRDVVGKRQDLFGAWQSALMVDTEKILEVFSKEYYQDARPSTK